MPESPIRSSLDIQEDRAEVQLERAAELWRGLEGADPEVLAAHTGASYDAGAGALRLAVWGRPICVAHPGFAASAAETDAPLDPFTTLLLAYYFARADGTPESGKLIAFSELPDATFYTKAFQGYTGAELSRAFGNDLEGFSAAATALGGRPEPIGDRAFSFQALPLVRVTVACWQGDEDFPASYRVLFDAAISHHLPTDAGAILGSTITGKLIAAQRGAK